MSKNKSLCIYLGVLWQVPKDQSVKTKKNQLQIMSLVSVAHMYMCMVRSDHLGLRNLLSGGLISEEN